MPGMERSGGVYCSDNLYLTVGDIRKLMTKNLVHGDLVKVQYQESGNVVFSLEFLIDFDDGKKKYERIIDAQGISTITIGSDPSNTIVLIARSSKGMQYVFIRIKMHFCSI